MFDSTLNLPFSPKFFYEILGSVFGLYGGVFIFPDFDIKNVSFSASLRKQNQGYVYFYASILSHKKDSQFTLYPVNNDLHGG